MRLLLACVLTAALVVASTAAAGAAPRVQTLIIGQTGGTLFGPSAVPASATRVRVGRRICGVADGTALAVLAAARRRRGPAFQSTDAGGCDPTQLYVTTIGGQRARGQAGWVYKVGRRLGTASAASPSGPFGAGRLGSGAHVVWFWCRSAARCQRTLGVQVSQRIRRGGTLRVVVRGYDDNGNAVRVGGAVVRVGRRYLRTDRSGVASVRVRFRGGFHVVASARGLVRSFPVGVRVT